jgi:hypothetical protein
MVTKKKKNPRFSKKYFYFDLSCRLNPNATVRNIASERAAALSDQFPKVNFLFFHFQSDFFFFIQIIANHTFKHFDLAYIPFPLPEMIKQWTQQGGKVADLIEAVDGTCTKLYFTFYFLLN